jgi:hypothetical protein
MGEWWIDEHGNALDADGDVSDWDHEMYVVDRVSREIAEVFNYEPPEGPFALQDYYARKMLKAANLPDPYGDPRAAVREVLFASPKGRRAFGTGNDVAEAFNIAIGSTRVDGRLFAMRKWGWKRVAGTNIETFTMTPQDLSVIAKGLEDIYQDDPDLDVAEFNIEVGRKKYYTGVPYSVIAAGEPAEVAVGSRVNPGRRKNPQDETTRKIKHPTRHPVLRYCMAHAHAVGPYQVGYHGKWVVFATPWGKSTRWSI